LAKRPDLASWNSLSTAVSPCMAKPFASLKPALVDRIRQKAQRLGLTDAGPTGALLRGSTTRRLWQHDPRTPGRQSIGERTRARVGQRGANRRAPVGAGESRGLGPQRGIRRRCSHVTVGVVPIRPGRGGGELGGVLSRYPKLPPFAEAPLGFVSSFSRSPAAAFGPSNALSDRARLHWSTVCECDDQSFFVPLSDPPWPSPIHQWKKSPRLIRPRRRDKPACSCT
jgi:hypothetical protein